MPAIAPLASPPQSQEQLLAQARQLAGYSLGELAALAIPIPRDLKRDKGWTGILLELWLGASAGSKPEQDFAALGVELRRFPSTAGTPAGDHLRLRRPVNRRSRHHLGEQPCTA